MGWSCVGSQRLLRGTKSSAGPYYSTLATSRVFFPAWFSVFSKSTSHSGDFVNVNRHEGIGIPVFARRVYYTLRCPFNYLNTERKYIHPREYKGLMLLLSSGNYLIFLVKWTNSMYQSDPFYLKRESERAIYLTSISDFGGVQKNSNC